jgi:D-alanine-D-alanine ligase
MKIVVLKGGASSEREVSLVSGADVARALREKGHSVAEIDVKDELDPLPSGRCPETRAEESPGEGRDESFGQRACTSAGQSAGRGPRAGPSQDTVRSPEKGAGKNEGLLQFVSSAEISSCDVVFIALHGGTGENGTVQALLDLMRVPYTGSGMLGSALAMDKFLTKLAFEQAGIPTPEWRAIESADLRRVERAVSELGGPPVVTKPKDQGSTIGISIVNDMSQVRAAVDSALQYSPDILVEKYIAGKELTVGILGDRALPVVEIAPETGFYSYDCKYTKGKSSYMVPAEIDGDSAREAQENALQAFRVLGCADFSRVDFRLPDSGRPQCLEVNTVPGMTGTSLVPMAAKAVGIDFPSLVEEICRLTLARRGVIAAAKGV